VFSTKALTDFIENYQPQNGDFEIDEIIEDYIKANPNFLMWPAYESSCVKPNAYAAV
jgi:hypothetical protein